MGSISKNTTKNAALSLSLVALLSTTSPLTMNVAYAADPLAGDACTNNGQFIWSANPSRALICDGSNWLSVMEVNTDSRSLMQVNTDAGACTAVKLGRLRYDGAMTWEYCDGDSWENLISGSTGGADLWTDNTSYISYNSGLAHFINTGETLPATLDDNGTRMFFYPDKAAFRGGTINGSNDAWQDGNIGQDSFAFGRNVEASNYYSVAMGQNTTASFPQSVAMGFGTTASGKASFAMGSNAIASAYYATSMGYNTEASGNFSVALGGSTNGNTASGIASFAVGDDTTASGNYATALGRQTTASGRASFAAGENNTASGSQSVAMGRTTTASGYYSIAMGYGTNALARSSVALGSYATASGGESIAMGYRAQATGNFSVAMGYDTTASGNYATALGRQTTASGQSSFAAGENNTASGNYSFAAGNNSTASGDYSVAMGGNATEASGTFSIALGNNLESSGASSVALGYANDATGDYSIGIGFGVDAHGQSSISIGLDNVASGERSAAFGSLVTAGSGSAGDGDGDGSFAFGLQTANQATKPRVTGDRSAVFFMDGNTTNANSGFDFTDSDTLAVVGGKFMLSETQAQGANAGCIQFNAGTNQLEYADDCSSYTSFASIAAGTGLWSDDTTHISYQSTHIIKTGQPLPAALDDAGTRMFFYPDKAAFRGGTTSVGAASDAWQDTEIGSRSFSWGRNVKASGVSSTGFGRTIFATGNYSVGMGRTIVASGAYSVGMGFSNTASGRASFVMGEDAIASGDHATAFGELTTASGDNSFAAGYNTTASGDHSIAMGYNTVASGDHSVALGRGEATATNSFAVGHGVGKSAQATAYGGVAFGTANASGQFSFAAGRGAPTASGIDSIAMGLISNASGIGSVALGTRVTAGDGTAEDPAVFDNTEGHRSFAFGLQTASQATAPIVTGDRSAVFFMDGNTANANSTFDFTDSDTLAVVGGKFMLSETQAQGAAAGCIQFNAGTNELEYADDCSTYTAFSDISGGGGSSLWTDNTTYISYTSGNAHIINTGETLPAALDDNGTRMFFYPDKGAFRGGLIAGSNDAWQDANVGSNSFTWGRNAQANGSQAVAFGEGSTASGNNSVALGIGSTASGPYSFAMGNNATASSAGSVAMGYLASATAFTSFAIGYNSVASGGSAVAFGSSTASGNYATAWGSSSTASGNWATAGGQNTTASGDHSFAAGNGATVIDGTGGVAIGSNVTAGGNGGTPVAMGINSNATGTSAVAIGYFSNATGYASVAMGRAAYATGIRSVSISSYGLASGQESVVLGGSLFNRSYATGYQAIAIGTGLTAGASGSMAFGKDAEVDAAGAGSMVFGVQTASQATKPQVSGDRSAVFFMDGNTANANSGFDFTDSDTLAVVGGKFMLSETQAQGANAGCIQFNAGTNQLEYSDDCTSYTSFASIAAGTGLWSDDTSHISYQSTHIIKTGQTLPAALDDNGIRMFFYPDKSAFRGGRITANNDAWQDANIGVGSFTWGINNEASAYRTVAMGADNTASSFFAIALGGNNTASGNNSVAMGRYSTASGEGSVAMGGSNYGTNTASGTASIAMGNNNTAGGNYAVAMGYNSTASGPYSFSMGRGTIASGVQSVALGRLSQASGVDSFAFGSQVTAGSGSAGDGDGDGSFAFGLQTAAQGIDPIVTGDRSVLFISDGGTVNANNGVDITASDSFIVSGMEMGIGVNDPQAALHVAGDINFTGFLVDLSDRRLKTDITPLSKDQSMLEMLQDVDTYSFRMKSDVETLGDSAPYEFGVMAQDLEEIFPELVKTAGDEDKTKSVNYLGFIAPLIEAVKELSAKNKALEKEVEALEASSQFKAKPDIPPPKTSSDPCQAGDMTFDDSFLYMCTDEDDWKRWPLQDW